MFPAQYCYGLFVRDKLLLVVFCVFVVCRPGMTVQQLNEHANKKLYVKPFRTWQRKTMDSDIQLVRLEGAKTIVGTYTRSHVICASFGRTFRLFLLLFLPYGEKRTYSECPFVYVRDSAKEYSVHLSLRPDFPGPKKRGMQIQVK